MHDAVSSAVVRALLSARSEVEAAFTGARDANAALAAAATTLETALSAHGEDPLLLTALGAVACDRSRYTHARGVLQRALALGSYDRHAAFNLGVALINSGRVAQAQAAFKRARTMTASAHTWEAWFDPQAH